MKTTKLKHMISLMLCVIVVVTLSFPTSTFALTPSYTSTTEMRNAVAKNWSFNQQGYRDYNCLSWALGNTTTWTWPWGEDNPTISQVNTYMTIQGYRNVGNTLNNSAEIYAYGFGTEVVHFSRKINSSLIYVVNAKWGKYELFDHTTLSPYKETGPYGSKLADYKKG